MKIIENILDFFKRIFNIKEDIKMLNAPEEKNLEKKTDFIQSLKTNIMKNKRIETLICFGDGLGIQTEMKY